MDLVARLNRLGKFLPIAHEAVEAIESLTRARDAAQAANTKTRKPD